MPALHDDATYLSDLSWRPFSFKTLLKATEIVLSILIVGICTGLIVWGPLSLGVQAAYRYFLKARNKAP